MYGKAISLQPIKNLLQNPDKNGNKNKITLKVEQGNIFIKNHSSVIKKDRNNEKFTISHKYAEKFFDKMQLEDYRLVENTKIKGFSVKLLFCEIQRIEEILLKNDAIPGNPFRKFTAKQSLNYKIELALLKKIKSANFNYDKGVSLEEFKILFGKYDLELKINSDAM